MISLHLMMCWALIVHDANGSRPQLRLLVGTRWRIESWERRNSMGQNCCWKGRRATAMLTLSPQVRAMLTPQGPQKSLAQPSPQQIEEAFHI